MTRTPNRDRRATLRTTHETPGPIAAAVRPDHTSAVTTTVRDGRIETRIERPTTGGLRATVDDYVVNLRVAEATLAAARRHADADADDTERLPDAGPMDGTDSTTDDANTTTRNTRDTR